jgi:hypothetical protein
MTNLTVTIAIFFTTATAVRVSVPTLIPTCSYIVHVVVQTSSPSSPSSPPYNFQSKFSVANENPDASSPPLLSISNPTVGDEYHMHWCPRARFAFHNMAFETTL